MIGIDNDDEDDDYEMLIGFMPSYLDSEMDSFRDDLTCLMQKSLR